MFDDQSKKFCNQFVLQKTIDVNLYKEFMGDEYIDDLKELAKPLEGKSWVNVNSTCVGGGVAEMLHSVVPFAKGLGINCRWYVIEGTDDFFAVTKKFHNMLQGEKQPISMEEIFHAYLETVEDNMQGKKIVGDMVVVHDPQPAAAVMSGNILGNVLWRCHIDTSQASRRVWRFLLPYINHYEGAIFTSQEFVKDGLHIPTYAISPCIDPLKEKNIQKNEDEAKLILKDLFAENNIDATRPIVLAVSRYDIHKNQKTIVQAFKELKADGEANSVAPQLIIVGNSASDDPEGQQMYEEILKEIDGDSDIYPLLNIENNDQNIGALMALAKCFVHVSTKEGFGLVVTEAMWQGAPVIGSNVGGIKQQVIDGQTGFLVEPHEVKKITAYMKHLLLDEKNREMISKNGVEHIRNNFLLPVLVRKYVILMRYYLEIDSKLPQFRMNELTYKEIKHAVYSRKDWHFSVDDLKRKIEKELQQ